ncbi:MAG: pinensin family lanthipeptide [Bacteroidota bacterium]
MKKIKLNLNALKVKSFVTNLDAQTVNTIKGRRGELILNSADCSVIDGCPTTGPGGSICPEPSEFGCTTPQPTNNNASICVCN